VKYTNRFDIDPAIARAVMEDRYELTGDVSVTGLLRPAQIAGLEYQHEEDLTLDVSEGLWRLLGSAVHEILARQRVSGALQEHKLVVPVEGWEVSGTFDILYTEEAVRRLKDYKVSTVWSYIYGKAEWEAQVNLYVYMARIHGLQVDEASISLIMRDWHEIESKTRAGYPPRPFMEIPMPLWTAEETGAFLLRRVLVHQEAREGRWAECTDEERWARPTKYAVGKPKNKRARRVYYTKGEADSDVKPGELVTVRPGENIRCERYCPVRRWCAQADRLGVPNNYSKAGGVKVDEYGIPH
jgi:hypothetical protein